VEVVNLLPLARRTGARIVGITNTPDSPLGQEADVTLPLEAAFDHNASITMYSGLALAGGLLASAALGDLDAALEQALATTLSALPPAIDRWREPIAASGWLTPEAPAYFLARGGSLASCHEARLLWEEATKAPASAMTTGGFRHGPQEMLRPETRIGLWIDGERLRSEDLALAADLRRLGTRVMVIGQNLPAGSGDLVLSLPPVPAPWQFLIDIIPAQLAAEQLACLRGQDCDSFRICPYIIEGEGGLLPGAGR
jgi:glutamine---fructose-6-phosphate transaminase (isomerizing)